MIAEPLAFAAISDVAGKLRGKGFPVSSLDGRSRRGLGWTPTNVQITCFDVIAESPFGSFGDVLIMPDRDAEFCVDFDDGLPAMQVMMSDLRELDGSPWVCCTRHLLRDALADLERIAGVRLVAAFEHEFQLVTARRPAGDAYTLAGFDAQSHFLSTLMAALREAGLRPETVMREYGEDQYEVTVRPTGGLAAADAAALLRELTRATAVRCGEVATFTPIRDPAGVGNGVHIHLSFQDLQGAAVTHDGEGVGGMSALTASFVAGVLRDLDALVAFTAPSVISYARLTPHRWSAAFNSVGVQDREAAIRICPVTPLAGNVADQFNIEFRAADAAASPHLALAALVRAGLAGIEDGLPSPPLAVSDLSLLGTDELARGGWSALPTSLDEALGKLARNERMSGAFSERFIDIYRLHKQGEINHVRNLDDEAVHAAYEAAY